MSSRFGSVTSSRFERRIPRGKNDILFKVAFASDGAAARFFKVSRMSIWRWRHDRTPLPRWILEALPDLIQTKVAEAHDAQQYARYLLKLSPQPPRPLSGCCAAYDRKPKNLQF